MKKATLLSIFTMLFLSGFAQAQSESLLRESGKIYVVVGVLCIIFTGIILFLIRLDLKLKKLENKDK